MWTCGKCGREFKRVNQGHYCGKAPETVEEYMALQPPEARARIAELREMIRGCAPDAVEKIAWSMPVYKKGKISVSFAACKSHISLYADAAALEEFRPQLGDFVIKKNAVYLPYAVELPAGVICGIVKRTFGGE